MSWRKEYKAAQQRRVDKIARNKKLGAALKTAFESGRNTDKQNALAYQMKQSLGLGGLFGGALHITP